MNNKKFIRLSAIKLRRTLTLEQVKDLLEFSYRDLRDVEIAMFYETVVRFSPLEEHLPEEFIMRTKGTITRMEGMTSIEYMFNRGGGRKRFDSMNLYPVGAKDVDEITDIEERLMKEIGESVRRYFRKPKQ